MSKTSHEQTKKHDSAAPFSQIQEAEHKANEKVKRQEEKHRDALAKETNKLEADLNAAKEECRKKEMAKLEELQTEEKKALGENIKSAHSEAERLKKNALGKLDDALKKGTAVFTDVIKH